MRARHDNKYLFNVGSGLALSAGVCERNAACELVSLTELGILPHNRYRPFLAAPECAHEAQTQTRLSTRGIR